MKRSKFVVLALTLGVLALSTTGCDKGSGNSSDSGSFAGSGDAELQNMSSTGSTEKTEKWGTGEKSRSYTAGVMSILSGGNYSISAITSDSKRFDINKASERWSISGVAVPDKYREQGVERVVQTYNSQYLVSKSQEKMIEVPDNKRIVYPSIVRYFTKEWADLEFMDKTIHTFKNAPYDCEEFKNKKTGKIVRFFYVENQLKGYQEEGSDDYIEFLLVSPLVSNSDIVVYYNYGSLNINFD